MTVFRRRHSAYTGPLTPVGRRFLVLPRYAALDLAQSRLLMAFLVVSSVPFLVEALLIYLAHSPLTLAALGMGGFPFLSIDKHFFMRCLGIQGFLAFVAAAWVGPGLISPDLANGGLPLILSRALSRAEYVAGKALVLLGLLSLITWVPGLLLFLLKGGLAEDWMIANLRIAAAILAGSAIWIALLALISLALSALIRRRLLASLAMLVLFFAGTAFGEMWRSVLRNTWGRLANPTHLIEHVWRKLFGIAWPSRPHAAAFQEVPTWAAWLSLLVLCALCLWLLERRVRAKEIVR